LYIASIELRISRALVLFMITGLTGCAVAPPETGPAAQMDPQVQANFDAAMTAAAEGQTERAGNMLSGISDTHPELVAPQLNLAILYAENGREDESEALLLALLETRADEPEAWNQLGILRRKTGRFEEADVAYLAALEADPDYARAHRNRGVLLDLYLNRPAEAVDHYRRFVQLNEGDEEVERWIAELELRLERTRSQQVAER
jgi:tetratricopeptide (TPR) repeat protein